MASPPQAGANEHEWSELVDGPGHWTRVGVLLVRWALLSVPLLGAFGVLALYDGMSRRSFEQALERAIEPTAVFALVTLLVIALACVGRATVERQSRRRRDLVLGRRTSVGLRAAKRLCWTASLMDPSGRFKGSLHLSGGVLRFLWHRPQSPAHPGIDMEQEVYLQLLAEEVSAVETAPAATGWQAFMHGSHSVQLLLGDGRKVRLVATRAQELADALRQHLAKPAGTPAEPPATGVLDLIPLPEIGAALVRRFEHVALVVDKGEGLDVPFVVLHGTREELQESLGRSQAVLAVEEDRAGPYLAARRRLRLLGDESS